jgi:hypothetical protein
MSLDIVGAGFGRTGTLSLKLALEQLGLGPCYHMFEVGRNSEHVPIWRSATEGDPVDWQALFADYRSTVDWPACRYWRDLSIAFPKAKILLSVRPADAWYESVLSTIYRTRTMDVPDGPVADQLRMADQLVWMQTFDGRFEDRAHAIEIFESHNESVRDAFDGDRLLVYEVGSGWEPLCEFFDVPVPNEDYPRTNTRESFQERMAAMR